jgi:hypothetical protein
VGCSGYHKAATGVTVPLNLDEGSCLQALDFSLAEPHNGPGLIAVSFAATVAQRHTDFKNDVILVGQPVNLHVPVQRPIECSVPVLPILPHFQASSSIASGADFHQVLARPSQCHCCSHHFLCPNCHCDTATACRCSISSDLFQECQAFRSHWLQAYCDH